MTGAEHYAKSLEALEVARIAYEDGQGFDRDFHLRVADIHATLALVQATLATGEYADWDASEPVKMPETIHADPAYL